MRNPVVISLVLLVAAGCVWDRSSVEPQTVIRIDRDALENELAARQESPDILSNENAPGFGVAPYLSPPTSPLPPVATPGTPASSSIPSTTGISSSDSTTGTANPISITPTGVTPVTSGSSTRPASINPPANSSSSSSTGISVGTTTPTGATLGTGTTSPAVGASSISLGGTGTGSTNQSLVSPSGRGASSSIGGTSTGSGTSLMKTNSPFAQTNLFGPR
jgi:hypothetical protein